MAPADLEDFSKWTRIEIDGKRYRKRVVKRFIALICEEPTKQGFEWWIIEEPFHIVDAQHAEAVGQPPLLQVEHERARSCLTPAQIQAFLDPIVEVMHNVVQVRRTGEVPVAR